MHTEQGVDFFNIILLETLEGNFSLTGSFSINGERVYSPNPNNEITDDNSCNIFNGVNNVITGLNNTIVGSSNSTVKGQNNTIVGGISNDVSGDYSTAIGSYINILHTGAMVLKDSQFTVAEDNGDDTLTVQFNNGIFLQNQTYLNDRLWLTGGDCLVSGYNITTTNDVNVGGSGLFSGDIQVLGSIYRTGVPLQDLADFRSHSGNLSQNMKLASGILQTGVDSSLSKNGGTMTGNILAVSGFSLVGDNNIIIEINDENDSMNNHDGDDYFENQSLSVVRGSQLLFGVNTSGYAFHEQALMMNTSATVPSSHDSYGLKGQCVWDDEYFYVCTGWGSNNSGWSRVAIGNWN